MKLREALLDKKRVKVGSGTSFVYCGPVDASRIEKHSGEELARLKAEQAEAERFIEEYPRWKDIFIKNRSALLWRRQALAIKRGEDNIMLKTKEEIISEAKDEAANRLERNVRRNAALTKKIEEWVPFLDREVVEQYKSIVDRNVDIIIFSGDEEGAYWDEEEYVKANGPFEEVEI